MSFMDELKARTKRGAGSVEVYYGNDEKPLLVPLRYPTAQKQAEFVQAIDALDDKATGADAVVQNENLVKLAIRSCIRDSADIEDEDLIVLIRESGGPLGALAQRCQQLLGVGEGPNGGMSRVVKDRKRGR